MLVRATFLGMCFVPSNQQATLLGQGVPPVNMGRKPPKGVARLASSFQQAPEESPKIQFPITSQLGSSLFLQRSARH